jgi:uncharacterized glyoxalase superfamily protein PhnB
MPDEAKDLIMHSRLTISGTRVMFSDTPPYGSDGPDKTVGDGAR